MNKKSRLIRKLVIQGSHMVSGALCPAGSDPVKKWSESMAAAHYVPRGRHIKTKKIMLALLT